MTTDVAGKKTGFAVNILTGDVHTFENGKDLGPLSGAEIVRTEHEVPFEAGMPDPLDDITWSVVYEGQQVPVAYLMNRYGSIVDFSATEHGPELSEALKRLGKPARGISPGERKAVGDPFNLKAWAEEKFGVVPTTRQRVAGEDDEWEDVPNWKLIMDAWEFEQQQQATQQPQQAAERPHYYSSGGGYYKYDPVTKITTTLAEPPSEGGIPDIDAQIASALKDGDFPAARKLRNFRDAPTPENALRIGLDILKSPGDYFAYEELLRGTQANIPFTGERVVSNPLVEALQAFLMGDKAPQQLRDTPMISPQQAAAAASATVPPVRQELLVPDYIGRQAGIQNGLPISTLAQPTRPRSETGTIDIFTGEYTDELGNVQRPTMKVPLGHALGLISANQAHLIVDMAQVEAERNIERGILPTGTVGGDALTNGRQPSYIDRYGADQGFGGDIGGGRGPTKVTPPFDWEPGMNGGPLTTTQRAPTTFPDPYSGDASSLADYGQPSPVSQLSQVSQPWGKASLTSPVSQLNGDRGLFRFSPQGLGGVPGGGEIGRPRTLSSLGMFPTPSAQGLSRLTPSERDVMLTQAQMLGFPTEDILADFTRNLPSSNLNVSLPKRVNLAPTRLL